MSASLVHFAVCDDVCRILSRLSRDKVGDDIKNACNEYPNYTRLGSIGPDLPYFGEPAVTGLKMFLDIHIPITPSAYILHSKNPNLFVVNLFRLITTDRKDLTKEKEAYLKLLAFVVGYLTHMATDRVIHPFVNEKAEKYYVSDENKVKHRMIEIYQDIHLFEKMYSKDPKKEFESKNFEAKIDIVDESFSRDLSERFWDTELTFRVLLQRAFLETYGFELNEKTIEDWVDGAMLTLSNINRRLSPYSRALYKPKDEWKKLAFNRNPEKFYNPDDPIVKFSRKVWKNEKDKPTKLATAELNKHLKERKDKSLYAKSILQSVDYAREANKYLTDEDSDAFRDALLPDSDLSDPQNK
jgi:hypothetical protein